MPFVDHRWLGGMLTNFKTVKQSIKRLKDMEADGRRTARSRSCRRRKRCSFQREMEKLERSLGGIKDMDGLPDALFVIDVGYQKIAITEAQQARHPGRSAWSTPTTRPDGIDYVIPGNDDSSRAIRLYARGVADAVLEGRSQVDPGDRDAGGDEFVEVEEDERSRRR